MVKKTPTAPFKFSGIPYNELTPVKTIQRNPRSFYEPSDRRVDFPNYNQLSIMMNEHQDRILRMENGMWLLNSTWCDSTDFEKSPIRYYVRLPKGYSGNLIEVGNRLEFVGETIVAVVLEAYFVGRRATGWVEMEIK